MHGECGRIYWLVISATGSLDYHHRWLDKQDAQDGGITSVHVTRLWKRLLEVAGQNSLSFGPSLVDDCLYHVTVGGGIPVTLQTSETDCPSLTITSLELTGPTIRGGTEIVKHTAKQMYQISSKELSHTVWKCFIIIIISAVQFYIDNPHLAFNHVTSYKTRILSKLEENNLCHNQF